MSGSTHSGLSDVLDMISNIVSSEIQGSIYRARFSPNTGGRGGATSVSEDLSSQGGGRNTESGNRLLAKMATIHVPIFVAEDRDM